MQSCGVFSAPFEKPLIFPQFFTDVLWRNLWRVWKSPVNKWISLLWNYSYVNLKIFLVGLFFFACYNGKNSVMSRM